MIKRIVLSLLILAAIGSIASAQPCKSTICTIVGSAGQSNELGANARYGIGGFDVGGAGTYMLDTRSAPGPYSTITALQDQVTGPGCCIPGQIRIGSRVTFTRLAKDFISPGVDVLVVPGSQGGVGFTQSGGTTNPAGWAVGATAYENFVVMMQNAFAFNAGNTCAVIFWGSGEADGSNFVPYPTYVNYFTSMVADFRTRVPQCATAPWVLRGMVPAYGVSPVQGASGLRSVQGAIMSLGTNYTHLNFLFVSSQYPDLTGNYIAEASQGSDVVHYSAYSQRQLAWRELKEFVTKWLCLPIPSSRL